MNQKEFLKSSQEGAKSEKRKAANNFRCLPLGKTWGLGSAHIIIPRLGSHAQHNHLAALTATQKAHLPHPTINPAERPSVGHCCPTYAAKLLTEIDNGLGGGIGRFNGFGICLIVTLRNNQVYQFLREIHVRLLQGA